MAVRPLRGNEDATYPGDSDDDPGLDDMMEEFDHDQDRIMRQEWRGEDLGDEEPRPPQRRPRYQSRYQSGDSAAAPGERSPAAGPRAAVVRVESEEELEQRGFFGSRKSRMLGEPFVPTKAEREAREITSPLEVVVCCLRGWTRGFSASSPRSG